MKTVNTPADVMMMMMMMQNYELLKRSEDVFTQMDEHLEVHGFLYSVRFFF